MTKFEYETEYVPRYYGNKGKELESPANDILKKRGDDGWFLCAVGSLDSVGTCTFYFCKEVE